MQLSELDEAEGKFNFSSTLHIIGLLVPWGVKNPRRCSITSIRIEADLTGTKLYSCTWTDERHNLSHSMTEIAFGRETALMYSAPRNDLTTNEVIRIDSCQNSHTRYPNTGNWYEGERQKHFMADPSVSTYIWRNKKSEDSINLAVHLSQVKKMITVPGSPCARTYRTVYTKCTLIVLVY
jgi:hypothetical protein